MRRSQKLKLALAIYGISLYTGDSGSDLFVGMDLIKRCHDRFAAAVFTFMFMPGVMISIFSPEAAFGCQQLYIMATRDGRSWKLLLLLLIPFAIIGWGIGFFFLGLYLLIRSAIKLDSATEEESAKQ